MVVKSPFFLEKKLVDLATQYEATTGYSKVPLKTDDSL